MLVSIFKSRGLAEIVQRTPKSSRQFLIRLVNVHRSLMVFFFVGYLAVALAFIFHFSVITELFVGTIFIFGALFVLLGITLNFKMVNEIRRMVDNLEERVEERTLEIRKTQLELQYEVKNRLANEDLLTQQKTMLEALVDNVSDAIIYTNSSREIVLCNPGFTRIFGYEYEEVVGNNSAVLFKNDSEYKLQHETYFNLSAKARLQPWEVTYRRKNGELFTGETLGGSVRDSNNKTLGYLGLIRDITDRKRKQEEMKNLSERLSLATRSAELGIWDWDITNNTLVWDDKMHSLYATDRSQFSGEYEMLKRSIHPKDRDQAEEDLRLAIDGGKGFDSEFRILWPDQSIHYIKASGIVQKDNQGKAIRMVGINMDITERKKAEQEVNEYATTLEQINSELDEFTHVASHDLQEPIRNLISYSALLEEDVDGELSKSAKEDLYYITDAAKRMKRLVEDLLSLSKTRRYELKFTTVSLSDCVDDALQSLHLLIHESGTTIHRNSLPEVIGDPTYLTMLYKNLIGNAIKFVKDGSPVIHLTVEKKDPFWIFGVQDNGIGIKDKYLKQIFAPFKRLHGLSDYEGTGIGLAICRKAVERHGGKIWVESDPGKGAHFKFTLPHPANNDEKNV